ncbi:hypothetical protein Q8F55_003245 [Vanrija albida]|uniref:Uncharacterized protein n=1 Tax=Vanrija albida TaxID=181172 RepID=A0ABR3QBZ1_9TREE
MGNILSCFPVSYRTAPQLQDLPVQTFTPIPKPSFRELVASPETCPGVHAINHAHIHAGDDYSLSSLKCCCQDLPASLDFEEPPAGAGVVWEFVLRRSSSFLGRGMFEYRASRYDPSEEKDDDVAEAEEHYRDLFDDHRSALYGHLLEHRRHCSAHRVSEDQWNEDVEVEPGAREHEPEYWDTYFVSAGGLRRRVALVRTPPGGVLPPHNARFW